MAEIGVVLELIAGPTASDCLDARKSTATTNKKCKKSPTKTKKKTKKHDDGKTAEKDGDLTPLRVNVRSQSYRNCKHKPKNLDTEEVKLGCSQAVQLALTSYIDKISCW